VIRFAFRFRLPAALLRGAVASLLLAGVAPSALAEPWLAPGDVWLRSDLQRLSDAGVITSPITTWPLSWADIAHDINQFKDFGALSDADAASLTRVRGNVRENLATGLINRSVEIRLASAPQRIRSFEDTPRGELETRAIADWTGTRFAGRLQVAAVSGDAVDDQSVRLDGSYAGVVLGNWMFSAGWQDRYWGPGWGGSLILGNAMRPVPGIALQRNYSEPFETRWLSWIGPWTLTAFAGQLESDREHPRARLIGARVAFRPTPAVEIGLKRTAQWCGQGRPCDFTSFRRLMLGNSNRDEEPGGSITPENEPGNQLAGLDFRWQTPLGSLPYAVYGQFTAEDEAGGFPSQYMGLIGAELWGRTEAWGANYRLTLEASDTTCRFSQISSPSYRCAYRHSTYTDGYRYRNQPIGYGTDSDARVFSVGGNLRQDNGSDWQLQARFGRLNRGPVPDQTNVVTPVRASLLSLAARFQRDIGPGELELGLGYEQIRESVSERRDSNVIASVDWLQRF
jgi:hypothetical protein